MFGRSDFNEFSDILRAAAAAAAFFQAEFGSQLAGQNSAGSASFPDVRLGDSLAQAEIHTQPRLAIPSVTIMRSVLIMPLSSASVKCL